MKSLEITTHNPAETIELGRKIGCLLEGSEVFAIEGPLGSGKTHLIKGIVAGANGDQCDRVNSPTFVLVNEYPGKLDVFHIDEYRLETTSEFELLGFDDFLYPNSVVLIEWADKVHAILDSMNCISVTLDYDSKDLRSICLSNAPSYLADL